jgi:hypothetical protein
VGILLVLVALLAPVISTHDPTRHRCRASGPLPVGNIGLEQTIWAGMCSAGWCTGRKYP